MRRFSSHFDAWVHTRTAAFTKLSFGSWRIQVRRKGRYASETFLRRHDARRWATEAERQINRDETPNDSRIALSTTFGDFIDLHIDDMCDVGKAPLRSKAAQSAGRTSRRGHGCS